MSYYISLFQGCGSYCIVGIAYRPSKIVSNSVISISNKGSCVVRVVGFQLTCSCAIIYPPEKSWCMKQVQQAGKAK